MAQGLPRDEPHRETHTGGAEGFHPMPAPAVDIALPVGREGRSLSIYPAAAGYDLQQELDFLSNRVIEPNVFFTGRFLAPAMPRVEDRFIRLLLLRDEAGERSRLRLLMPFSVERPGFAVGPSIMRVWANTFGPLGTPLLDAEDAGETLDHMLDGLAQKTLGLPDVLVLPELRLEGAFAEILRAIAISRGLPVAIAERHNRPILESALDSEAYLHQSLSKNHIREMKRQWRRLSETGKLVHEVARQPDDIHRRFEEFLALEASGWKGRQRSALVVDRYRSAFAREAVTNLAEIDGVRIHTIDLNGEAIASMIVFVLAGQAYTWKTAYNEDYAAFSPGKLLMMKLTEWHLDDANILRTDSCAVPDHPVMGRFWRETVEMGTLIIGLTRRMTGTRDRSRHRCISTRTPGTSPASCATKSAHWPVSAPVPCHIRAIRGWTKPSLLPQGATRGE